MHTSPMSRLLYKGLRWILVRSQTTCIPRTNSSKTIRKCKGTYYWSGYSSSTAVIYCLAQPEVSCPPIYKGSGQGIQALHGVEVRAYTTCTSDLVQIYTRLSCKHQSSTSILGRREHQSRYYTDAMGLYAGHIPNIKLDVSLLMPYLENLDATWGRDCENLV